MEEEITFADGNVSAVTRVGATVRRAPGFWTPAAHALLRYLDEQRFAHAPKVLGFDAQGREILSYVAGCTAPASLAGFRSDQVLVDVARLLRAYHDVSVGFRPPADAVWQTQIGAPTVGEVICHNDIAPWNTVFQGEQPVAFLDWDFAAPGPRLWDVAHALWRYAPLYADDQVAGSLAEQVRRVAVFCHAYGVTDWQGLLETIEQRQQALYATVMEKAQAGVASFVRLRDEGHAALVLNDSHYLRRHHVQFEELLRIAW